MPHIHTHIRGAAPTPARTWRISLNPRAHYNLSCGKGNRLVASSQLRPDDIVSVVSLSPSSASRSGEIRVLGRQCSITTAAPSSRFETSHACTSRRRVVIHRLTRDFGTVTRVWAHRATRVRSAGSAPAKASALPQHACMIVLQCQPKVWGRTSESTRKRQI